MFISEAAACSIVREIREITGRNINIMDQDGVIVASTDPQRVGQRHAGACQVLEQGLASLVVQEDEPRPDGARRGINLPICLDGQTVGVIGSRRIRTARSWTCGGTCWASTSPPAGPW